MIDDLKELYLWFILTLMKGPRGTLQTFLHETLTLRGQKMTDLNFHVYSKDNCKYCTMAIDLLQSKGVSHTVTKLVPSDPQEGEMLIDEFKEKHPTVRTVPYIVDTNTNSVYTYQSLVEYLQSFDS